MKKNTLNTVRKIIDAGCRLFAQNGYSATSVDEIMKEAIIRKPHFICTLSLKRRYFYIL